ncbi:MAG: phosphatidylglycerophosphatase A [Candidatus Marinimicrobia bacterium]|jgi:phosphatidylglycerophosphatase A|nr:phosphatidylglycerophosphatase A [Candidatus Neomarinimicrobiota bacterium]MBT3574858.1 phosphatidylglycerophosphatase A [Candidatus Neomarinimicrobiota bacterium]MBT3679759.1 phosphatidylglycerophosphatase A [Candidatus Neomarinimicrobiota bacterium]MBT3950862.1 phosphatidylglycerophosphatase A [Candidatus Neomarinimicrobiota bacterium]MBT4252453.1 phosphatidylglycerophosphatase A [Candidatus Neomarinimicrobiota bacterium]
MIQVLRGFTSVGYIGLIPGAPGTYGSLVTLPIAYYWGTLVTDNPFITFGVIAIITLMGVFASNKVGESLGVEDPGEIVIDELVGQWIAVLAIPAHWGFWLAAFILFRVFDIWKPWLIDKSQHLPGGIGVMMDDVLAGLLALAIIQGVALVI